MARWKLANPHYINSPDTEWEYSEVDRKTGRPRKMKLPVPRYLDPRDPADWNNTWGNRDNPEGEIIVCLEGRGEDRDYIITGDPTPDMIPLDDEARAISATFADRWSYKPDLEMPGSYSLSLIDKFQSQMADIKPAPVEIPGLADLVAVIITGQKQTAELIESLTKSRRV